MIRRPPRFPLFPSTPLSHSLPDPLAEVLDGAGKPGELLPPVRLRLEPSRLPLELALALLEVTPAPPVFVQQDDPAEIGLGQDRKSTRLNSSHANISYAVFCL